MSQFSVPTHLEHKPILAIRDYNEMDGKRDPAKTDAQHLSIGVSQWSQQEISLKVWRHSGTRWSRQSEELPLHRAIDLVSLLGSALYETKMGNVKLDTMLSEKLTFIPEGQKLQSSMEQYFKDNENLLKERLNNLMNVLEHLKKEEII